MTRCVLSSCFEPFHIYHGFCHTHPSVMFFACWTSQHHEGVFRSLVQIHIWWWRRSSLVWVLRRLLSIPWWCRRVLCRRVQLAAFIYTLRISTTMVLESTSRQRALTWAVLWSHWIYFPTFLSITSWPKNCYNNRRPQMNRLWNFGAASTCFSFKLQKVRCNSSISWIDLSIVLPNLLVLKESSRPSPAKHTSVMELRNERCTQSLSQVIVHHPLIKKLHHCKVMWENRLTHPFNCHILPTPLLSIFT